MNARDELLAAVSFNDAANTGSTPEELVEAHRLEVIGERDAQIIAWLWKKAAEEGRSNRDSRTRGDVLARMADKLSRGAVRPPLSTGPDAIEYGVAFTTDDEDGVQVHTPTESRSEASARVARYLDTYPSAHLVQRTVRHGEWTDVAGTGEVAS